MLIMMIIIVIMLMIRKLIAFIVNDDKEYDACYYKNGNKFDAYYGLLILLIENRNYLM